jgi:predicted glycoside hydrolase/deacetylase ChbG (UPF0249 family)
VVAAAGRVVAVCADDIGLVAGAADTALGLAAAGRLNAISCVSTGRFWRSDAPRLVASAAPGAGRGAELGLHFNLTEGAPASRSLAAHWPRFPGLGRLILGAHFGRLPLAALADEWRAQVDAFSDAVGREPDFIDGHQHVHHLPGVRRVVLDGVAAFRTAPAIRNTGHLLGPATAFKRKVIEASGGRALEAELEARGLRHNSVLLGAYDFQDPDYGGLVTQWIAAAPTQGALLFCHPCAAPSQGDAGGDPIAAARGREAAYLGSARFGADLDAAGVSLGPAWATRNSSAG